MDNPSNVETNRKTLKIALISVLAVICLSIQISPRPPNVEFTSLFTFFTGFIYGPAIGGLFGSFVMLINGFLSTWGYAGLNMPFQMAGMSLIGLAGGLYGRFAYDRRFVYKQCSADFFVEIAVLGAFLTVLYDLITNFGYAIYQTVVGVPFNMALIIAIAYGTPFSIIHVLSNAAVFGVAFFPLVRIVNKMLVVRKNG